MQHLGSHEKEAKSTALLQRHGQTTGKCHTSDCNETSLPNLDVETVSGYLWSDLHLARLTSFGSQAQCAGIMSFIGWSPASWVFCTFNILQPCIARLISSICFDEKRGFGSESSSLSVLSCGGQPAFCTFSFSSALLRGSKMQQICIATSQYLHQDVGKWARQGSWPRESYSAAPSISLPWWMIWTIMIVKGPWPKTVEMGASVPCLLGLEMVLLAGGPPQSRTIPANTLEKLCKANCSQEVFIGLS